MRGLFLLVGGLAAGLSVFAYQIPARGDHVETASKSAPFGGALTFKAMAPAVGSDAPLR